MSPLKYGFIVVDLMYAPDFKNPNDPNDKSFQPHPTKYPVAELEYPNSFASERCGAYSHLISCLELTIAKIRTIRAKRQRSL